MERYTYEITFTRLDGQPNEIHEDHAIMEADGMHLWIDDDTAEMFS